MLQIKAKLKTRASAYRLSVGGQIALTHEERAKGKVHTSLVSGEPVALMLPGGESLRPGDLVTASDGRVIEVVARKEKLLQIECGDPAELVRVAYRLGNLHVAMEVAERHLRFPAGQDAEGLLEGLGVKLTPIEAAFQPEAIPRPHPHHEKGHGGEAHACCDHDHHHGHDHHHHK